MLSGRLSMVYVHETKLAPGMLIRIHGLDRMVLLVKHIDNVIDGRYWSTVIASEPRVSCLMSSVDYMLWGNDEVVC